MVVENCLAIGLKDRFGGHCDREDSVEESLESPTGQRLHWLDHDFSWETWLIAVVVAYMGSLDRVQSFRFKEIAA